MAAPMSIGLGCRLLLLLLFLPLALAAVPRTVGVAPCWSLGGPLGCWLADWLNGSPYAVMRTGFSKSRHDQEKSSLRSRISLPNPAARGAPGEYLATSDQICWFSIDVMPLSKVATPSAVFASIFAVGTMPEFPTSPLKWKLAPESRSRSLDSNLLAVSILQP